MTAAASLEPGGFAAWGIEGHEQEEESEQSVES
jgi:hypothetical protein